MKSTRIVCLVAVAAAFLAPAEVVLARGDGLATQGRLEALDSAGNRRGSCPLKDTRVSVDIAGFVARVTVRQRFHNPLTEKIEAVYVFPLSQNAAVDRMTMKVGSRRVRGEIKDRDEARVLYESAKARGKVAGLLDQERPNVFTQSVANIEPGAEVDITIAYSETLRWTDGEYQFVFPMTVEPRYMPGDAFGDPATGWSPPTAQVPDADRISPPVPPEGTRAGHDIAVTVHLHAGISIRRLDSRQHAIDVEYSSPDKSRAVVTLQRKKTIPNKDFVLVYETAGDAIADTLLTHTDERGKFFTLVLQPPKRMRAEAIVPKEIIFAIDKSGSMQGFPIDTARQAMRRCIEGAHPSDTFNLICFDGGTSSCFEHPVPNTEANRRAALAYLDRLQGSGGTEMMEAIETCLASQGDGDRVRIVCFMTDGCVGNDLTIIDAVRRNAGTARVFSFGVGKSVNRFLLDGIARASRGEAQYILDERDAAGAAERFHERVRSPVLTDVKLDFGGLAVTEVYPQPIPDLFSSTPVVVQGRYAEAGKTTITLTGRTGEGPFQRKIDVAFLADEPAHEVLAPLWARAKVEHLLGTDLSAVQLGQPDSALKEAILGLGLRYRLLTPYTSFVAIEEQTTTEGGPPVTVAVPVEMPEGVSYEGIFGAFTGPALSGRGEGARAGVVARYGGTASSERTVALALRWLADHQTADGSWRFDPPPGSEKGYASTGAWQSPAGATGLALLPFLGAGQTPKVGKYRATAATAIDWLIGRQKPDGNLASGDETPMLSHGLAALALNETYGMTADKRVGAAAQEAIRFIAASQDAATGGWTEPGGRPSMSVTIWQVLALKSAARAYLDVPPRTLERAARFLDSLQTEGARYGETGTSDTSDAATIAGLLGGEYLRTEAREVPILGSRNLPLIDSSQPAEHEAKQVSGTAWLSQRGPSTTDAVSNFHATLLMHYLKRPEWSAWQQAVRDPLVAAQAKEGDEAGSWWNPDDVHAARGGRLFLTAIHAVTLEVYYRHLPLFRPRESEE